MKIATLPDGSPEIFRTLQGEGPSIGCPAVFIRLSLCNLHCSWCDTPYTWNWEGSPWEHQDGIKFSKNSHLQELTPITLSEKLRSFLHLGDRLVITGGEPLLQQKEIIEMLNELREEQSKEPLVEVETNGTQRPLPELDAQVSQFNVSPKLANSNNAADLRIRRNAFEFFAKSPKAFFKFVVTSEKDVDEILTLQEDFDIPATRILLMPEGRTPSAIAERRLQLVDLCLEHGFRLTDRLHVQIWGDERGR